MYNTYGFNLTEIKTQAENEGKEELVKALDVMITKEEAGDPEVQGMYDRLGQCWTSGAGITTISPKYLLEGIIDPSEAE